MTVLINSLPEPILNNPAQLYLDSLSANSRPTMRSALVMLSWLMGVDDWRRVQWGSMTYTTAETLRNKLRERYEPANTNKMLTALRCVARTAFKMGEMDADTFQRIRLVKNLPADQRQHGRALSEKEITSLFLACTLEKTILGRRDHALLSILWGNGLRRSEVCALNLQDYNRTDNTLRITGKGRKERIIPVSAGVDSAIRMWLNDRGTRMGPLICPITRGGRILFHHMHSSTVFAIVKQRGKQAGLKDFSPHDFRRTFVGDLLDNGVDIATVRDLAGHANVNTTARYDRRGEQPKRRAIDGRILPGAV